MSISFSGVGSGLPIDEWVTALTQVKQNKVDVLTEQQKNIQKKQSALNSLKTNYSAVNSSTLKFTDSLMGAGLDIFTKTSVSTSETSVATATVTKYATPSAFELEVQQLASRTVRMSDENNAWRDSSKKLSDLGMTADSDTITINGASISLTEDMTIDSLIYKINNTAQAGVNASIERGHLVLKSKELGEQTIDVSGSFANLVGLRNNDADHLTEGTKAIFKIDGVEKFSNKNTLTSEDTGILGLTLDLMSTTDYDPESGESIPVRIEIEREYDSDATLTALQDFISSFNKMIANTDSSTDSGVKSQQEGLLHGENSLVNIRNNLRTLVTSQVNNAGNYKSLADIGITTGSPGTDVNANTNQLVLDVNKFVEAFEKDPASVKALLIGENTGGTQTDGLMQKMQTSLKSALDTENGYFTARSNSLTSQISSLSDRIARQQELVYSYQERLLKQFNYMDQQISLMNQQFTQMQQQLKQIGISVGDS